MGTRADFYVGRGKNAEWLGSIAWDGHPGSIPGYIIKAVREEDYRKAVDIFLRSRDDGALPERGWPWPWNDSNTTDYAYAFDERTYACGFGHGWFDATQAEPEFERVETVEFPDMSARKNVTFGKRSGVIVLRAP